MITLTNKDGIVFDVDVASLTTVESLNPLSALAHKAKSLVVIEGIEHIMVKEDICSIVNMIIKEVIG